MGISSLRHRYTLVSNVDFMTVGRAFSEYRPAGRRLTFMDEVSENRTCQVHPCRQGVNFSRPLALLPLAAFVLFGRLGGGPGTTASARMKSIKRTRQRSGRHPQR
jgi:hypothetical protein